MAKDTRTRMLDATARLIQLRGYHGTALNDVLAESGAPRGSLYFHFPGGKEQLATESTRAAVDGITQHRRSVLAANPNPAAAVRAFGRATVARLRETNFAVGCPIAPVVLDGIEDAPVLSKLCQHTFEQWIGLLRTAFLEWGIPGERADALALLTQSSFEGALMIARAYRDATPIARVANEIAGLIEAASPPSRGEHAGTSHITRPSSRAKRGHARRTAGIAGT